VHKHTIEDDIMMNRQFKAADIDGYIAQFSPEVQAILQKIRSTIKEAAPEATEKISYQMPSFAMKRILIHFAAFKEHIGIYPPVRGDAKLLADTKRYQGPKGNLKFPLDEPIPYALIGRIVKSRVKLEIETADSKRRSKSGK
jgi:uncharacterized protein YdhG (YjbR/CyaY superfamily)